MFFVQSSMDFAWIKVVQPLKCFDFFPSCQHRTSCISSDVMYLLSCTDCNFEWGVYNYTTRRLWWIGRIGHQNFQLDSNWLLDFHVVKNYVKSSRWVDMSYACGKCMWQTRARFVCVCVACVTFPRTIGAPRRSWAARGRSAHTSAAVHGPRPPWRTSRKKTSTKNCKKENEVRRNWIWKNQFLELLEKSQKHVSFSLNFRSFLRSMRMRFQELIQPVEAALVGQRHRKQHLQDMLFTHHSHHGHWSTMKTKHHVFALSSKGWKLDWHRFFKCIATKIWWPFKSFLCAYTRLNVEWETSEISTFWRVAQVMLFLMFSPIIRFEDIRSSLRRLYYFQLSAGGFRCHTFDN